MKLLTPKLLQQLPTTAQASQAKDPTVWVKFFYPDFSWTWLACGYDPADDICWGLVDGDEIELGPFSLSELKARHGKLGCSLERDYYFAPRPLSQLMRELKQQYPTRTIWGWSD